MIWGQFDTAEALWLTLSEMLEVSPTGEVLGTGRGGLSVRVQGGLSVCIQGGC